MNTRTALMASGVLFVCALFSLFTRGCFQAPVTLQNGPTQFYAHFRTNNGSLVHVVTTDTSKTWSLVPDVADGTRPTTEFAKDQRTYAAVNGGYFNLSDGKSASYVIKNGNIVADPTTNEALTNNPKLKPYLEQIFNRSEFRILLDSKGDEKFAIGAHDSPVPEGFTLDSSLQAGPQLLPAVTDEEEAFVRQDPDGTQVDSIGARRNAARTALGIRPDGTVILVAVAGKPQDSSSPGLTLKELAGVMRQLGCVQALNLDGGNSTTMFVYPPADSYGVTACGKNPETRVKSVLLLLPKNGR